MNKKITQVTNHNQAVSQIEIDQQVYDLYDEYCHGKIDRREFLAQVVALGVVGALGMAQALFPRYVNAQTISFTDERIKATYVTYPSAGGNSGTMRGYMVQPTGTGDFPAVVVIHENRGLNPYIEDVARRLAVAGFLVLAPDGLAPVGGYPGNDDDGRALQAKLDQVKLRLDLLNSALYIKNHSLSNKKLGAIGFCYGGGIVNYLAAELGGALQAGVPYYGVASDTATAKNIKAPLLINLAEKDERVNNSYKVFETELKNANVEYQILIYPNTQHGFHNNSTPRYDEANAKLSWEHSLAHFNKYLK